MLIVSTKINLIVYTEQQMDFF